MQSPWSNTERLALAGLVPILLLGCGARTTISLSDLEREIESPPTPTPNGVRPASLRTSQPINLFQGATRARAVSRSGGFDLIGSIVESKDRSPRVTAMRASVRTAPLRLDVTGDQTTLIPSAGRVVPAADRDLLTLCYDGYNGDAPYFASFEGAYLPRAPAHPFARVGSCDGLAFHNGHGLVALHAPPTDGSCCSRAAVFSISQAGGFTSEEREALPSGELADVALTDYGDGFAWAGYLRNSANFSLRAHFDADTRPARDVDLLVEIPDNAGLFHMPAVARWPFDERAFVIGFELTPGADAAPETPTAHVMVVRDDGSVLVSRELTAPAGMQDQTPILAATSRALIVARLLCARPSDAGSENNGGQLLVEAWESSGNTLGSASFPISCWATFASAAVLDDVVLLTWSEAPPAASGVESKGLLVKFE